MVKGVLMEDYIANSRRFIINSYVQLLLYYYKTGIGKVSEIAGVTITEKLINTIERRYKQLGGNPTILKLNENMPSVNGRLNRDES